MFNLKSTKIGVIGLGYVGLPLAVEFAKKFKVIGYDINQNRINELNSCFDKTNEVDELSLRSVLYEYKKSDEKRNFLKLTSDYNDLSHCNFYIITVPTPIDKHNRPDLNFLLSASKTVASVLKKNDIVVYESTVYPGCTEEDCVPILEKYSGLKYNIDFYVGYSPERINPGDKEHTFTKIKKVVSGSTTQVAQFIKSVYSEVVEAGTYLAPSIKVAEAAKVIENTQRDINIAFVNELAMIFNKMGIDTLDVLEAAGTKWNFLPFKPGLVGGHCIGVDPYYLAHKSQEIGHHPEMILAGRRINDYMGIYVANQIVKLMIKKSIKVKNSKVLILGITFKENCPDIRNTKVIDIITELKDFGCVVDVYDPHADVDEVKKEYGILMISKENLDLMSYNAIVLAVSHKEFREIENILKSKKSQIDNKKIIVYDVKGFLDRKVVTNRL